MKIRSHNLDQFAPFTLIKDLAFKTASSNLSEQFYNNTITASLTAGATQSNITGVFNTPNFPAYITQINTKVYVNNELIVPDNYTVPIDDISIQIIAKGSTDNLFGNKEISVYTLNDLATNNDKFIGFIFAPIDNFQYTVTHKNPANWTTGQTIRVDISFSGVQIPIATYQLIQTIYKNISEIQVPYDQMYSPNTVFIPAGMGIGSSIFNFTIENLLTATSSTSSSDTTENTVGFPLFVTQITNNLRVNNTYTPYTSPTLDSLAIQITDVAGSNSFFANTPISIYALQELGLNNDSFNGLLLLPNKGLKYTLTHSPSNWTTQQLAVQTIYSGLQVIPVSVQKYESLLLEFQNTFMNKNI
jgi:hypothetical protein